MVGVKLTKNTAPKEDTSSRDSTVITLLNFKPKHAFRILT